MKVVNVRPNWHSYWMTLAVVVAARGTCLRRQCGAVIVKNNRIISSGYNGAPSGFPHCDSYHPTEGCYYGQPKVPSGSQQGFLICRAVHAEVNAIFQAARYGSSIEGAYIYSTNEPCKFCTEAIVNAGIHQIFYFEDYEDREAREMRKFIGLVATHVIPFNLGEIRKERSYG